MRITSLRSIPKPLVLITFFFITMLCFSWIAIGLMTGSEPKALGSTHSDAVLVFNLPERIQVNEPFQVVIRVDTGNNRINAAGLYLRFDPDMFQLLQQDTRSSFCQFYPEKRFDNRAGLISLACGSPHPGFMGSNTLMTLEFLPLKVGTGLIRTDPKSQILLSDGKGSNILTDFPQVDVKVGNNP